MHLDMSRRAAQDVSREPTKRTYDVNVVWRWRRSCKDRLWVNGSFRRWVVDEFVSARNLDGTQAIDDNTLKNYSVKGTVSINRATRR